jgi:predicted O-methyltransferase YrrM
MEHFYQNINGFMSHRNTILLDIMFERMPENCQWVELGSWTGKSAAYCVVELINRNKLGKFTCVDSWEGDHVLAADDLIKTRTLEEVFHRNMAPVIDQIDVIKSISWNAAAHFNDNSLDFCYIDAGHTYEDVKQDLEAWWSKIKPGAWIGGDDYTKGYQGLMRAVDEFFSSKQIKVTKSGRCWIVTKPL